MKLMLLMDGCSLSVVWDELLVLKDMGAAARPGGVRCD